MTPNELTTLAAAIRASTDPDVVAALAIRNDVGLADLYNRDSTFVVWRSAVPPEEYREAIVWADCDALSAAKARSWEWLTGAMTLPLDTTKANVRAGLADVWPVGTTRTQLLAACKRYATQAEALFATGSGTSGTPGTLVWEGMLGHWDVSEALNKY
jgi:hypothetical protein